MGKFTFVIPKRDNAIDSDIIRDIRNQLSRGKKVVIVHNPSLSSRDAVNSLLKRLPLDDVYRVRPIEESDFEHLREIEPATDYYQISAEGILGYLPNSYHQPVQL